jgi:hypothetical protein
MRTYWTSPAGILRRARDKANPYKRPESIDAFRDGWANAGTAKRVVQPEAVSGGNGAYAKGWNARVEYEAGR